MKKLNKKGFTLIEMVIVVVIIAILAAVLVPSLLAYVDNANEKKLITASDTIRKCITTEIAEMYKDNIVIDGKSSENDAYDDDFWEKISSSANATIGEISSAEDATYYVEFVVTNNKVSEISVSNMDKIAELVDGSWVVSDR